MTYQHERDEAMAILKTEGMPLTAIRTLFRLSQTLHRLAVAQCNGDWPADNGERKVVFCPTCQSGFVASSYRHAKGETFKVCPDCYATTRVKALLVALNNNRHPGHDWHNEGLPAFRPIFAGDPRGCVLKVRVPSGRTNDSGREGICIPVRER